MTQTFSDVEQAQGELSLARVALAEGDLYHAANHVGGAVSFAPALPEVHELLAALVARSHDDGLSLFSLEGTTFIGTVVAHAHLLAPSNPQRALTMLTQATNFDPSKAWADAPWVRVATTDGFDVDELCRSLINVVSALHEPVSEQLRRVNEVYLELARHALAAHPEHAVLHGVCSAIARRLGDPAEAVAWGARGVELQANKLTYVWYAYALRVAGRLDAALDVMSTARAKYPLDIDLSSDAASWLADAGRLDEALLLIEDAVRIDPSYDCGVHTLHRLRFQRDRDALHLVELSDFVRSESAPSHEHTDLADCCQGRAWLGEPAGATESVVNVLEQVPPGKRHGRGTLTISQMEVPSALAMLARTWPEAEISYPDPTPALVTPLRDGPPVWRLVGTRLVPGVLPPTEATGTLLVHTVSPRWPHPVAAYDQALPLGAVPARELIAALVHPPARPREFADLSEHQWMRSVQVFACVGLLHSRELASTVPVSPPGGNLSIFSKGPATPTVGDNRAARQLLTQLAFGVEDWITEAALYGLIVAAWVDPACRDEVADVVVERFAAALRTPDDHVVTILPSLAELVLVTPGVPEGGRRAARTFLDNVA